jgi:hypothetical protein
MNQINRFIFLGVTLALVSVCHSWGAILFTYTSGSSYDFRNGTYYSPTGEPTPSYRTSGNSLILDFSGYNAIADGTKSVTGMALDFATANVGMTVTGISASQAIISLELAAKGNYSVQTPSPTLGSYASVDVAVPVNITVTSVNGVGYNSTALGRTLTIAYSATPSDSTPNIADSPPAEAQSGTWSGSFSDTLQSLFPSIFASPTMKVTELSLAITPNLTAFTQGGAGLATVSMDQFFVTAIPEPSPVALMVIGGGALMIARRFRRA